MSGATQAWYRAWPAARVGGAVRVPGDKSISHRALLLGGIASGETRVSGFLESADCLATMAALRALGVRITQPGSNEVIVRGAGADGLRASPAPLDMGNAGTAMRLSMGLLCGQPFSSTLVGDASLMQRPMERVATPLRLMGARIDTRDGRPPVVLHGGARLHGIDYPLPMASAQVKSALLLAGLGAAGTTRVTEPAPTRDHTERMFGGFGVAVHRDGATVALTGGQILRGADIRVPGDFSSAAFFIVAGCLAAPDGLTVQGVGVNPTRTGLLDMLRLMGGRISVRELPDALGPEPLADITIHASPLRGAVIPPELVPLAIDELPILFIAAACADGETVVTGAGELRVKESDRLAAMAEGLLALGVRCELLPDGIRIQGGRPGGGRIDSHGDHRIAMSFAIASLRASAPIEISDVANVGTSFPGFPALARAIGMRVEETGQP
ncbi:MAG: 3-phosphoshikimate 1-carboxyvinyltransferase [Gammaproteobacteria bacterium]|nr:3-phosphoshikimate 1-carboxyvinyltransferase [Gammaproteobacteria bacterium]MDE2251659.1 3-phosphoshikimate 1-carboxyvinyltransferase [Gammaproteobacteria bacterium]